MKLINDATAIAYLVSCVNLKFNQNHIKSVQIRSFFWSVFSCIQTEYRKIRTREKSVFGHFSSSKIIKEYQKMSRELS